MYNKGDLLRVIENDGMLGEWQKKLFIGKVVRYKGAMSSNGRVIYIEPLREEAWEQVSVSSRYFEKL